MTTTPPAGDVRRFSVTDVEALRYVDDHVDPHVFVRVVSDDPAILEVSFPPGARVAAHAHPNDTLYVIRSGEFHVEGEGAFQPGEARWVRGGVVYGPEWAGEDGASILVVSLHGAFSTVWEDPSGT